LYSSSKYYSGDKIKEGGVGHVVHMREIDACTILVGRPVRRWEDNIKMALKENVMRIVLNSYCHGLEWL
jgi:hypothetical protein